MDTQPRTRPRLLLRPARPWLAASLALAVVGLGACSGVDGAGGDGSAADKEAPAAVAPEEAVDSAAFDAASRAADEGDAGAAGRADVEATEQAVIHQGEVTLVADDVARARDRVEEVVDEHLGEIADQRTETDDDGVMEQTRLVLRVPSADFAEVLEELSGVAELRSATSTSEDVTTQVIDTRVRVRAQEKSLRRIEQLLARAQSLRDIVAIEAQLTRRQADLDSLKSQQAYLADQTTMGTLTVRISKTVSEEAQGAAPADEKGFLAGLSGGWDALKGSTVVLATVAGALLPFAIVLGAVAVPVLLLLRVRRTRRPVIPA